METQQGSGKLATDDWWVRFWGWRQPSHGTSSESKASSVIAGHPSSDERIEMSKATVAQHTPSASIAAAYQSTGTFDELVGTNGAVADHWTSFLSGLEALSHKQRLDRIDRINMRVRETGIAHDLFADPSSILQPWRLDLRGAGHLRGAEKQRRESHDVH